MKNNNHVYLITHIPSGLQYVGMHLQHANIRFESHMLGFGAKMIYNLIQDGYTREDFKLEILECCSSEIIVKERETYWISVFNTEYPFGLNAERATSTFKKYNRYFNDYLQQRWDLKYLLILLFNNWKIQNNTKTQNSIEKFVKYQSNDCEIEFTEKLRQKYRQKYSIMETLRTNNKKFLLGRKKMKDRMNKGEFTEAEKNAFAKKSDKQKEVWSARSEEEKMNILCKTMIQYKNNQNLETSKNEN